MNNLGNKLKFLRKKLNLTQKDLTCEIINRSSLSKIENNLFTPSVLQLKYLATQLNVSIDYLLDDNIPIVCDLHINKSKIFIRELYSKHSFFRIIEEFKPQDFTNTYYIGMSYYKLDLKADAELLLSRCECLFNSLSMDEKLYNVENLCIAINSLRKIRVSNLNDSNNIIFLKKALAYLDLYNEHKCEIYFIINNNIGVYYIYNKEYENAINHFENFFNINFNFMATTIIPSMYLNLSLAYFTVKIYDKSIEYIHKAIFFYNLIGDEVQAIECHLNLFNCYLYKNDITKCRQVIKLLSGYHSYPELNDRLKVLELTLLYNLNDLESILEKKKSINYMTLKPSTKTDYNFILARVNFINKNYNTALLHYNKCIKFLNEKNKLLDLSIAYLDLFTITGYDKYMVLHINCKKKYLSSKNNNLFCDITSPYYIHLNKYIQV